jgi:membrane protease YdiL (CAAX protease family)
MFVLPLILTYESLTLGLPGTAIRSGLDQWISYFLSALGLGQLVFLPVVATLVLLLAHHRQRDHGRVSLTVVCWMGIESIGLGLLMFWAANAVLLSTCLSQEVPPVSAIPSEQWWPETVALIGSGIYEELVFRLILLTWSTELICRWTGLSFSHWIAIVIISLLFAALHYDFVNPAGGPFEWSGFLFRCLASVVFSVLFLFRGFGVAVGTHVAYDLLAQL